MQRAVFRSKVDWWLACALLSSAGMSVAAAIGAAIAGSPYLALGVAPLVLIGGGLPLWLLRSTHYTFDDSHLHIRSGPFGWLVPLRDIRAVTPTRNPLSSPALSLDRLRIEFGRTGSIMVSPEDKDGFLAELRKRVPTI
ncbi:MAG: PH domain-containing protein [Solimonas sp.]